MGKTITIRQREGDEDFKAKLKELRNNSNPSNPYFNRSESEIVKMLLREPLIKEYNRICVQTTS
jgi:hypothetical protein